MKVFYYYMYYRLYQQTKKVDESDETTALFVTLTWITSTILLNLATVMSLITICVGIDAVQLILRRDAPTPFRLAQLSIWCFLVWCGLKFFHVHEKACSGEMVEKYKQMGFKGWWVIAYFIASFIAMGVTTWIAGARLGLH